MASVPITTKKGQVTIPKSIREPQKLHSGDKIEIIVTKKREAIIRPISKSVDDLFRILYKPGRKAVTIEVMNDAIRNRVTFPLSTKNHPNSACLS